MPIMDSNPNNHSFPPHFSLEPSTSRKRKQENYPHFHPNNDETTTASTSSDMENWVPTASSSFVPYNNPFLRYDDDGNNTGVGENLNDIQRMLSLEDHDFEQEPHKQQPLLQLHDLQTNYRIQSWNQASNHSGNTTPGFFTPGFLESLQEESHPQWPQQQNPVHNHMQPFGIFAQESTPSSPIPNTSAMMSTTGPVMASSSSSSTTSSPSVMATEDHFRFVVDQRRLTNAKLLQHTLNETKLKSLIHQYVSNQLHDKERKVIILTSKVAQKSYGTEKRFLCPPPTAILVGTNWWTSSTSFNTNENEVLKLPDGSLLFPPKLTVSISGEAVQSGHIEWSTVSGTTVGQTGQHLIKASTSGACSNTPSEHPSRFRSSADVRNQPIELYNNQAQELLGSGKSVSKHLYINDADEKRKRVEAIVRIQLANGLQLGAFTSKGIKVISKPSKKRQSAKNMELCIHHGTTVSLFNRIRSQTVSTKYLGVSASPIPGQPARMENTCFVARTTSWDPFVIWLVNNEENSHSSLLMGDSLVDLSDHLPPPPAIAMKRQQMIPIHYNQHVVLQCLTTGLVSPVMILRKVDKASTVVGGTLVNDEEVLGDPVSQLHKVALQIVAPTNEPPTYLACLNDMVGMHKITEPRKPVVIEESTMAEKIVRKRRVSIDPVEDMFSRKSSISSNSSTNTRRSSIQAGLGACWQEDVSDAAVWTIVGTDCTTYSFMLPTQSLFEEQDEPTDNTVLNTTFPFLLNLSIKSPTVLHLHGENFSRDLQVWFGDLKLTTEYRSRELLVCQMPSQQELLHVKEAYHQIPVLFVRGDGTLCKTNKFYPL